MKEKAIVINLAMSSTGINYFKLRIFSKLQDG